MGISDLFSKRQRALRGETPDVYTYDHLPKNLRVQIIHIWGDALGSSEQYLRYPDIHSTYKIIVDILCREYGWFHLPTEVDYGPRNYFSELTNFLLNSEDTEKQLDVVELSFKYIDRNTREYSYLRKPDASEVADNAIEELNARFREHGIGFQYVEGEIIRVDSELIHSEVVKPALKLLNKKNYQGSQEEFLNAHEHYRHGRNKEALNDCLKAFESTMKAICSKRKWRFQPNATASALIQICLEKDLFQSSGNRT